MPELDARGLVVERGARRARVRVLDAVDLSIERGELVAVMGATGAGKSSLGLALAGLVPLAAGHVGGDAAGSVRLVLQRPESTFLEDRVLDEVSLAPRHRGEPAPHAERRALGLLGQLALPGDVAGRDPLALSGGEQRRVAIAAVLAGDPRVTILDEPSAGLDAAARAQLHAALRGLHADGRTIVVISHDPAEVASLATRLVVVAQGRVAWDGPPDAVLGDPQRAAALGIDVAPEVLVLHRLAARVGVAAPAGISRPDAALDAIRALLANRSRVRTHQAPPAPAPPASVPRGHVDRTAATGLPPLPARIDARTRVVACAIAVVAALSAGSLAAAAAVFVAAACVVAAARIDRVRVRLAVRPLLALAALLVLLQLLVGGDMETRVVGDTTSTAPALAAILRALQASAVVLATLALSAATPTADLAAAIRSLLAPLRLLRVPVDVLAFVVATGIGLVPALADELERLRLAQRARGLRATDRGPRLAALRADAQLLTPLFVAAFRRAHLLADALAVRGFDPRSRHHPWRAAVTPGVDVGLLVAGALLVALSRFA